jgi:hypothetical protein
MFWFSLQLLSETCHFQNNSSTYYHQCTQVFNVKYRLFLPDFSDTWIFSKGFRKILKYPISWKSVQGEPNCSMRTNRRTDGRTDRQTWQSYWSLFGMLRTRLKPVQYLTAVYSSYCWVCTKLVADSAAIREWIKHFKGRDRVFMHHAEFCYASEHGQTDGVATVQRHWVMQSTSTWSVNKTCELNTPIAHRFVCFPSRFLQNVFFWGYLS